MRLEPVLQGAVALTLVPGELRVHAGQRPDPDVGGAEHATGPPVAEHEHVVVAHLRQRRTLGLEVGHQPGGRPLRTVQHERRPGRRPARR